MMINAMVPFCQFAAARSIPWLLKALDSLDPYKTKKTSIPAFKKLWAGKDYVIDFKFANCLNIIHVTMMYGLGMPILFPIAAVNFFNQYVVERALIAYEMKVPPALDDKLIKNFVKMLKYAPLLFLMNGYWMVSNPSMF